MVLVLEVPLLNPLNHWFRGFYLLILLIIPFISYSQKIFSVEYQNQSDIKVYVVEYENQSDLKVFKVDYPNQVEVIKVYGTSLIIRTNLIRKFIL